METELRFLFIPVSGPGGTGEYFRSLAIARSVERRWPAARITFVVSRDALYATQCPYPIRLISRSPTYETKAVNAILSEERPHVVVFDSAGRVAQYRAAREVGARVVFISSRPTTRRKGFRLRRMRYCDQHWLAQPRFLGGQLTWSERAKLLLAPNLEPSFLDVLHEPVDAAGTAQLLERLQITRGEYLLCCPGGGGVFANGPDATAVFYAAAAALARNHSLPVIAVLGTRFQAPADRPSRLHVFATLPNGQLMGLVRDARVALINGGSLLVQALAQGAACVTVPIAEDQPSRIAAAAAQSLVLPAALEVSAMCEATLRLLGDPARRADLQRRAAGLELRNGTDVAVEALARLVPGSRSSAAGPTGGERLRVLQVILSRGFAGSERAVVETCNALCTAHEVAVVVRSDHRSRGGASILDHLDPRVELFEVAPHWSTRRALYRIMDRWRPDVVHTHLRRGTRYVAQKSDRPPHVCTLHLSLNGPHFVLADGIICISQWQTKTIPGSYSGTVFMIPNSLVSQPRIDVQRRAQLRQECGAQPNEFLIGGVGRLVHSKGFDLLLEAFARAALSDARLVIIGEGSARAALERTAPDRVRFLGFRADVKDCLQALDVFVSPSRSEPFGRVIVEALDAGLPVIATRTLGPLDMAATLPLQLVPCEDPDALAAALRVAHDVRTRPSADLSPYQIERVCAQLLDAYRTVRAQSVTGS